MNVYEIRAIFTPTAREIEEKGSAPEVVLSQEVFAPDEKRALLLADLPSVWHTRINQIEVKIRSF
jgi:hypothetical protein